MSLKSIKEQGLCKLIRGFEEVNNESCNEEIQNDLLRMCNWYKDIIFYLKS